VTDAELVAIVEVIVDRLRPTRSADLINAMCHRFALQSVQLVEAHAELARLRQAVDPATCAGPGCSRPLEQPATGRRRLYCSTRCKRRAARRSETGP
jgi:hypothetical protein